MTEPTLIITVAEQGPPGVNGDSFKIDASGTLAERDAHDGAAVLFSYLDTDTGNVYIKQTSGWSPAVPFRGPQGIQGVPGPTGATGPQGLVGVTGPQGPQGPQGIQGVKGDLGNTGPRGDTGPGLRIKDTLGNINQLPPGGVEGEAYLINGHIWVWVVSAYQDMGNIQGPQGVAGTPGATGAQGPQGAKGDTGAQGPTGLTGPAGAPGATGAQGPAGTNGAAGAAGAQGAQGPTGATGAAGPGVPTGGTTDQILVKNSNTNFDSKWTDSPKLKTVTFFAEYDNGNSGAAKTINFANGQKQKIVLTANTTLTIAAPPGIGDYKLRIIQNATGGYTLAFAGLNATRWWGSTAQPDHNLAPAGETLWAGYWDGASWSQGMVPVGAQ